MLCLINEAPYICRGIRAIRARTVMQMLLVSVKLEVWDSCKGWVCTNRWTCSYLRYCEGSGEIIFKSGEGVM